MSIHKDFPRPWHITHTARHRAHGYYSHIRAANDNYVVERITDEDLALYIVQVVNERDQLRAERDAANERIAELDENERQLCAERERFHEILQDAQTRTYYLAWKDEKARAEVAERELSILRYSVKAETIARVTGQRDELGYQLVAATARNVELEAKLAAVPVQAMLECIRPDDYDFSASLAAVEAFAIWLEAQREQQSEVQP